MHDRISGWTARRATVPRSVTAGLIAAQVMSLQFLAQPCRAIEFEPNEIVAAPPGTNAVLGYLYFNHLGQITAASPGGIPDHSAHANQFVELLRYAHWFNFGA